MKAYRTSVKLKLGLIVMAVVIAVASLVYTNGLANRLMQQEREAIRLWARAIEYQARQAPENPHRAAFSELDRLVDSLATAGVVGRPAVYRGALAWAQQQPEGDEIDFVFNEIVEPRRFNVPAVLLDTTLQMVIATDNVDVDSTLGYEAQYAALRRQADAFRAVYPPITLEIAGGEQLLFYGESDLVRHLRWFPFVQLAFVALFVGVGYVGFAYVRRAEQSSLWAGMAKEAAHQLGTPLSSMIGWVELLREERDHPMAQTVAEELDKDVARLRRVADRFSKIGSLPELEPVPLAPVVEGVADYIRRRMPSLGARVALDVDVAPDLRVALNRELFEWVVENLLKNALDAEAGRIEVRGYRAEGRYRGRKRGEPAVVLDVRDTGKGIERNAQKLVFKPGFSTKKRGWGLGLSLAKRIVEDYHGGSLALAESRVGHGTTFRIRLPEAS